MNRRTFAILCSAGLGAPHALLGREPEPQPPSPTPATTPSSPSAPTPAAEEVTLASEFLFDLTLDRGASTNIGGIGSKRVIVSVSGGTFDGPRLKGSILGPSGDGIVARDCGSSVLDLRATLQTDDGQKIYMACRGIAYTQASGALWARILPTFETSATRYLWLNNVVAVGVYRRIPGKVAYRIFNVL